MKLKLTLLLITVFTGISSSQYYFPPTTGNVWDTVSPASLGWCTSELDTLQDYLQTRNSRSFMILHKGQIAVEWYMNGGGQDSLWYWASASKSLMAFLIGMAQEDGLLDINDKTSQYLGNGWTNAPQAKEDLITIKHQITMTTGLDWNVPDQNCLIDTCLNYLQDAGTHWYYYNAPYRLTQDVLEVATGKNLTIHTLQQLNSTTGIGGFWASYIFLSKARSMARFGLLNLNKGNWDGTPILADTAYWKDMTTPSQNLNEAYGYLWWLNGQGSYKQPGLDFVFNGMIVPTAPADMFMAAGANDQRIYIVPGRDLVVVRQGDAAYSSQLALSQFDIELWSLLMNLFCNPVGTKEVSVGPDISVYPNPVSDWLSLEGDWSNELAVTDIYGRHRDCPRAGNKIDVGGLSEGTYILSDLTSGVHRKFMVLR